MFDYITLIKAFVSIYGSYLTLGLICFIILLVFGFFLISVLTHTPFSIGLGFFKIAFGNKNGNINKKALIDSLLEYEDEYVRSLVKIEDGCLRRQINYTEQKLSELKYLLTNSYSNLLSTKLQITDDVKLHKDYRSYQMLIGMLIKDMIDNVFEIAFIENHLDEMDSNTWKNYISDKTSYMVNYMEDFLDNLYSDGKIVTRKESYESERKLFPEVKKLFSEIFENVKEISIQSKEDIKRRKEESMKVVKEICKTNGCDLENS